MRQALEDVLRSHWARRRHEVLRQWTGITPAPEIQCAQVHRDSTLLEPDQHRDESALGSQSARAVSVGEEASLQEFRKPSPALRGCLEQTLDEILRPS